MGGIGSNYSWANMWFMYRVFVDGIPAEAFSTTEELNHYIDTVSFKEILEVYDSDNNLIRTVYSDSYKRYMKLSGLYAK